jgi:hypothetical protein
MTSNKVNILEKGRVYKLLKRENRENRELKKDMFKREILN